MGDLNSRESDSLLQTLPADPVDVDYNKTSMAFTLKDILESEPPTSEQVTEAFKEPPVNIDIEKIIHLESGGRTGAVSPAGAVGLMQIMRPTWEEMAKKMKVNWPWGDAKDPVKNRAVGIYYMNVEIPRLLKSFSIPDTTETRLAAYNWGIGNLLKAYREKDNQWMSLAPEETLNHITKYKR